MSISVQEANKIIEEKNKEYRDLAIRFKNVCKDLDSKDKEIERLQHNQEVSTKWEIKLTQKNTKLKEENKRLKSIIKEAIEYLESYNTDFKNCRFGEAPISIRELGDLLDILKGSDKE